MDEPLTSWVQATPDYALLFFLSQGSGVPDAEHSPNGNDWNLIQS